MTLRGDLDVLPDAFGAWLVTLFTAFASKLDRPTGLLYWRALHDVPIPLLEAALGIAVRERVYPSPPRPAEVRKWAEQARADIRQRFAWKKCERCRDSQGFVEVEIDNVKRMQRCECYEDNERTLRELGANVPALLSEPKALPPAADRDWTEAGSIE